MEISFGLITDGRSDDRVLQVIDSIKSLSIDCFEILVIGNSGINQEGVTVVNFVESATGAWITKKKNMITQLAKYEVIVFSHDYFIFDKDWYKEISKNPIFDVAMCSIRSLDGNRYRDWVLWPHNGNLMDLIVLGHKCLIPYDMNHLKEFMYISGSFWVANKQFMLRNPLNENLFAGQGEDVEWSFRIRNNFNYIINHNAVVYSLKDNPRVMIAGGRVLTITLKFAKNKYFKKLLQIKISQTIIQLFDFIFKFWARLIRHVSLQLNVRSNNRGY